MALVTLEGIYEDGKIALGEIPVGVKRSRVMVTFLAPEKVADADRREELRQSFLARLQHGVDFGSDPLPTREELYANRLDRF